MMLALSRSAYKRAATLIRFSRNPNFAESHPTILKPCYTPCRSQPYTLTHPSLSTMASNIVLPDLPTWVQRRITTLYSAKSADDFGGAFDAFVSENAKITVNGKSVSRDEYKKMIQGEIIADAGAEVTFNGLVSVPSEDKDLHAIGVRFFHYVKLIIQR